MHPGQVVQALGCTGAQAHRRTGAVCIAPWASSGSFGTLFYNTPWSNNGHPWTPVRNAPWSSNERLGTLASNAPWSMHLGRAVEALGTLVRKSLRGALRRFEAPQWESPDHAPWPNIGNPGDLSLRSTLVDQWAPWDLQLQCTVVTQWTTWGLSLYVPWPNSGNPWDLISQCTVVKPYAPWDLSLPRTGAEQCEHLAISDGAWRRFGALPARATPCPCTWHKPRSAGNGAARTRHQPWGKRAALAGIMTSS